MSNELDERDAGAAVRAASGLNHQMQDARVAFSARN